MTRTQVLRFGYVAMGLSFLALALTLVPAGRALLPLGLLFGFVGGTLLFFSDEDLPRWAGLSIVAYFGLCGLAFVASNGATIAIGGGRYFVNPEPPVIFALMFEYLTLGLPLLFVLASIVAVWEAGAPRWAMVAALVCFALVYALTVASSPTLRGDEAVGGFRSLGTVFSVGALAGAVGAFWASWQADHV